MKKISKTFLVMLMCVSLFCSGCNSAYTTTDTTAAEAVNEEEDDGKKLMAAMVLEAQGWEWVSMRMFIMTDRTVYFSSEIGGSTPYEPQKYSYEELASIHSRYLDYSFRIEKADYDKIVDDIPKINTQAEFVDDSSEEVVPGLITVYSEENEIMIRTFGDSKTRLDDPFAKEIGDIVYSYFSTMRPDVNIPALYGSTWSFITTLECPDADTWDRRRVITNKTDLDDFCKIAGVDLMSIDVLADYDVDKYNVIVEIVEFDKDISLEEAKADFYIVSKEYTGYAYLDPDLKVAVNNEDVHNKYLHVALVPKENYSIYCNYGY